MKLRVRGNSIRFRLTRPEVQTLAAVGFIEEKTRFGPAEVFTYRLETIPPPAKLSANFEAGRLCVFVPQGSATAWENTDAVAIEGRQSIDPDGDLRILIEKDFECLNPPAGESQADAFTNPLKRIPCEPTPAIDPGNALGNRTR